MLNNSIYVKICIFFISVQANIALSNELITIQDAQFNHNHFTIREAAFLLHVFGDTISHQPNSPPTHKYIPCHITAMISCYRPEVIRSGSQATTNEPPNG